MMVIYEANYLSLTKKDLYLSSNDYQPLVITDLKGQDKQSIQGGMLAVACEEEDICGFNDMIFKLPTYRKRGTCR